MPLGPRRQTLPSPDPARQRLPGGRPGSSKSTALVAAAGREVFPCGPGPVPEPLAIKVDTYVLETDVHFPTDLNLLFDAGRKCLDLIEKYRDQYGYELPGWRKLDDWRVRFKAAERVKAAFGGGKDKEKRVRPAVGNYVAVGRELACKVTASLLSLWPFCLATNCKNSVRASR